MSTSNLIINWKWAKHELVSLTFVPDIYKQPVLYGNGMRLAVDAQDILILLNGNYQDFSCKL